MGDGLDRVGGGAIGRGGVGESGGDGAPHRARARVPDRTYPSPRPFHPHRGRRGLPGVLIRAVREVGELDRWAGRSGGVEAGSRR